MEMEPGWNGTKDRQARIIVCSFWRLRLLMLQQTCPIFTEHTVRWYYSNLLSVQLPHHSAFLLRLHLSLENPE